MLPATLSTQLSSIKKDIEEAKRRYAAAKTNAGSYFEKQRLEDDPAMRVVDAAEAMLGELETLVSRYNAIAATRTFWPLHLREAIERGDAEACRKDATQHDEFFRKKLQELDMLRSELNTPEMEEFLTGVGREAAHQRVRWGSEHDGGKSDVDWFWLVGYLAGKALHKPEKRLHHLITAAAALFNWHLHTLGKTSMRPGIERPFTDGSDAHPPARELPKVLRDEPCPACGAPVFGQPTGGVRCSRTGCGWWSYF